MQAWVEPSLDELPTVSVVLVNYKGVDDTMEAISHLKKIAYPSNLLEVVVVDNASGDDSVVRLRELAGVKVVESPINSGFAGGCNLGVAESSGALIGFLNNDARPDTDWVAAAVKRFSTDERIGAVASQVLDWDGNKVDYIGAGLTWFGMGYKPFTGQALPRLEPEAGPVLFGTGSAMFVKKDVFTRLGGFDESYFMFFEDVDLGWRLNLMGWDFYYEPRSIAYHRHHGSMGSFGSFKEDYLLERNALFTLFKNLSGEALAEAMPAAIALAVARGVAKGGVDSESLDLRRPGGDSTAEITVPKVVLSSTFAVDQFVKALPRLRRHRDSVQSTRTRSDRDLRPLFGLTDMPAYDDDDYLETYDGLVSAFDVTEPLTPNNVLIITGDPIGKRLAGPAIRVWNMALALIPLVPVRVITLSGVDEDLDAPFDVVVVKPGDDRAFSTHERWADVIVFQGHAMAAFESLATSSKVIVSDIYDPMHLEQLEQGKGNGDSLWERQVADATEVLNEQLLRGDFFLAASERQRSFWLGQLAALGRVNPANYSDDPYLRGLIDVVPFGLSDRDPEHRRQVAKGVIPGIGREDKLIIWGGGIYDWFDPLTLVRAIGEVSTRHPETKLLFLGTRHPHPGVPEMPIIAETRRLASALDLDGRHVFFNEDWVAYDERENYLTEADAAVSTHFGHIETVFSFRTRILDYLWARLPMVVTRGDHFGELVERERLGVAVPPGDASALARGIESVLYNEEYAADARRRIETVRDGYRWSRTLKPLVAFATRPHPAADRVARGQARPAPIRPRRRRRRSGPLHDLRLVFFYLRHSGISGVTARVRRRLRGR